jgi:hypothetical protein
MAQGGANAAFNQTPDMAWQREKGAERLAKEQ